MKHLAGLILFCSIGMSCLAVPIMDPVDDVMTGDWSGRHLLRFSRQAARPAPAPVARPAPAPARPAPAPARPAPAPVARPAPAPVIITRHSLVARPPVARPIIITRHSLVVRPPVVRPAPLARRHTTPTHHRTVLKVKSGSRRHRHRPAVVVVASKPLPTRTIVAVATVATVAAVAVKTVAASNVRKQETAVSKWLSTAEGVHATQFCKSLGIENRPQIYDGCLEDMMVMKSEDIAKLGALTAEEFLSKAKSADTSKRYCIASGDPHFTSYDRDIYHLQEEGIFVIAGSDDDRFELQERVKKNGANVPGVPSCMIGAAVRFGDVYVEVDVYNYGKLRVNGASVDLAKDTTKMFGGVQVRYGKQNIAWRGANDRTTAMHITGPGGFAVMIEGGYCGTLEVNVPTAYFGKMRGLCGNADGTASNADFSAPDGKVMDVKRATKDWQMSGYGGPTSPLSKWQLVWKPTGAECLFVSGCEKLPATAVPIASIRAKRVAVKVAAPTPIVAARSPSVAARSPIVAARSPIVAVKVAARSPSVAVKVAAPTPSVAARSPSVAARSPSVAAPAPSVAAPTPSVAVKVAAPTPSVAVKSPRSSSKPSSKHLVAAIHEFHNATQSKIHDLAAKIEQLFKQTSDKQLAELKHSERDYDQSRQDADAISLKYDLYAKRLRVLKKAIVSANATFILHYRAMLSDNAYLLKLKLFKPSFIATLESLKTTLSGLESGVNTLIGLNPTEKTDLAKMMFNLRNNTFASIDEVAHEFLQFLEKHKAAFTVDTSKTDAAKKKLDELQEDYVVLRKLSKAAYEDYLKFADIVSSLKAHFAATKDESGMFDQLMHQVLTMLRSRSGGAQVKCKVKSFIHAGARTQCAIDLIKSHSHNGLLR